jgi:hypothetical protein
MGGKIIYYCGWTGQIAENSSKPKGRKWQGYLLTLSGLLPTTGADEK